MAGGGKTATSTSQVKIPPEVLARYNAVNAQAQQVSQQPFHPYSMDPNAFVAPLTPTQQMGIYNTNVAAGAAQPYYAQAGQALQAGLAGAAPMAYAGAMPVMPGQLGGQQIGQYMSPYLGSVVGTTMAAQAQQNAQQRVAMQGQAIQQGAFGGDRANIGQANLAYQQDLANSQTLANLMNQGYGQALTTAQQQQQLGLSAEQANRAALQQQAQNLYGMYGGYGQALAGLGTGAQQAALQGAQAQLAAGQAQQQTAQAGLAAMYNQFQQQQSYPFQVAQFLANIAMGTGALSGSTTTTTQPAPFFSDRRLKHDVHEIGKTKDGLPIYSFKYNGDDKTQIGLMAQDVEKKHPEAVGLAGGYKTVDYDMATKGARKADGGGLSSMGGAVGLEHAGLGFERGGYLGGGLVPAEDIKAILARQKEGYKTLPYGDSAFNVQGMPLGGGKGRVPLQGGVPTPSLAIPKQAAKPPESGMQQLRQAAGGLEDIEKLYGAGEKAYDWAQGLTQSPGERANAAYGKMSPEEFAATAPIPPIPPETNPQTAYRGGLIRAHREDGGEIDDEKGIDKDVYGETLTGKLDIPISGGQKENKLATVQNPSSSGSSGLGEIGGFLSGVAKIAPFFIAAKNGGLIARHGYEFGGEPQIDDAASWGEDRPNIYRTRGEEFRETRGVPQPESPVERPDARISGAYDRYQEASAPAPAGLAAGATEPQYGNEPSTTAPSGLVPREERRQTLSGPPRDFSTFMKQLAAPASAPNLSSQIQFRRPEGVSYTEGLDTSLGRPGLAERPDRIGAVSERILRGMFPPESGATFTPATLPDFTRGEAGGLEPPRGVPIPQVSAPTETTQEQTRPEGLAAAAQPAAESPVQYGAEPSGLIPRDMLPKKEVAAAQPPQVATAPTGGVAGNVQQVAPESVTVRPGAAIYSTLVNKESGGNQFSQNNLGYSGLTQMGAPLLSTIGVYSPGERENIRDPNAVGGWSGDKWSGQFNIPGHPDVKTIGDFLKNKDAQNTAYYMGMAANDKTLRDNGAYNYVGQTVNGVPVTRDGLLMGAWLGGTGGVMRWLKGEGDPADANGTRISNYVRMGSQGGQAEAGQPTGGLGGPTRVMGDTFNAAARSGTPQAQAVDNAATQRGLAPPPPDATPQERGTWMQRNREWVLPLLGFLGKMASSQSRFALGAALEGLSGAAQGMVSAERVGQEQQRIDIQQQDALIRQNADLNRTWGSLQNVHSSQIQRGDFGGAARTTEQMNKIAELMSNNQQKIRSMTANIPLFGEAPPAATFPTREGATTTPPAGAPTGGAAAPTTAPPPVVAQPTTGEAPPAQPTQPGQPTALAQQMKRVYPDVPFEGTPEAANAPLSINTRGRLIVNNRAEQALWPRVQDIYNIPLQENIFRASQSEQDRKDAQARIAEATRLLRDTGSLPGKTEQNVEFPARQLMLQSEVQEAANRKALAEEIVPRQDALRRNGEILREIGSEYTKLEPGVLTPLLSTAASYIKAFFPNAQIGDISTAETASGETIRKLISTLQTDVGGPRATDLAREIQALTQPNQNLQPGAVRNVLGSMIGTTNFEAAKTAYVSDALRANPALPRDKLEAEWSSRPENSLKNYIEQAKKDTPVRGDRDYKPGYLYVVEPGGMVVNGKPNTTPMTGRYVVRDGQSGFLPPSSRVQ